MRRHSRFLFVLVTGMLLVGIPAHADYLADSGLLTNFMRQEIVVRTHMVGATQPMNSGLQDFAVVVETLLARDYQAAADLADPLHYDLIRYRDIISDELFYILRERNGQNGQGTFIFHPDGRRSLNIQAPHPIVDTGTWSESIEIFLDTDAVFWQIAGTHRCASTIQSPCDGTTSTCGGDGVPYTISDVAHYMDTFYQVASDVVHAQAEPVVAISVHGYGCDTNAEEQTSSVAQISNGTGHDTPNSLATQLAIEYNKILFAPPINYPWRGAGSFNRTSSEPDSLQAGGCVNFTGGTNVQGRSINGAPTPCSANVTYAIGIERFLHLEQRAPLRSSAIHETGVSWQVTIDAISNLFVPEVWVDLEHTGVQTGGFFHPFASLGAAVAAATPGQTVRVKASQGHEQVYVEKELFLESHGGSAVIGID